jgi:Raf kinase inhibitor-like YbhB/YbcL family protein
VWKAITAGGLLLAGGCSPGGNAGPAPAARGPSPPASAPTAKAGAISLTTPSFSDGGSIPAAYTCDGGNHSPALRWNGAPAGTRSFVLMMHDPDAPDGDFTHWLLYDVPANTAQLPEGSAAGLAGANEFGKSGYGGPCPPPGPPHHYVFDLYALDEGTTGLPLGARRVDVDAAIRGHVLAQGRIQGVYQRK